MKVAREHELPPDLAPEMRRAVRLEWLTIAYLASVIALMGAVMGSSQAMKTAWAEDLMSLVPPVAFLVATRIRGRAPDERHPYGYHRAVTIAFLVASLALLAFGALLFVEAALTLVRAQRPSIGAVAWFGAPVWQGWVMLPVLVWSVGPPVLLGRAKRRPADRLHDKVLFADAEMNKADWTTGLAAAVGVLGVGAGFWWADAVAAGVISLSVLHDGVANLRACIGDLMDREPERVDREGPAPVPAKVREALVALDWVRDAEVRLRESGHVFFGEAFVVPRDERDPLRRAAEAREAAQGADWRVLEVVVALVPALDHARHRPSKGHRPAAPR